MNSRFIDRMIQHWTNTLRLPCTTSLVEGWSLLEAAVGTAAKKRTWQVLPLPTGSGKTEALITLLATPAINEHPGALVITKFKCEADRIARAVNISASAPIAIAVHADAKAKSDEMAASPVLVITHAAYTNALRDAHDADAPIRLELYHRYHQSSRSWLIIDEAFNWVDAYEVEMDDLAAMCGPLIGILPANALDALRPLLALVRSIYNEQHADRSDRLLSVVQIEMLQNIDFPLIEKAIRGLPTATTEVWRTTELVRRTKDAQRTTFQKQYLELVQQLGTIQRIGWGWISHRGTRTRLHCSRTLLDTTRTCGVILDGTAGIDTSYDLHGSYVNIVRRPDGIRSYHNVRVHVSQSHRVGKEYLSKHARTDWPVIADRLAERLKQNSKVLTITHKVARDCIRRCDLKCAELDVAHWGDLDGKNDWKDFDTVVVYGLPYLDDIAPTNAFLANTGALSTDWFEGRRQYKHHADMKTAIKIGFIARSVVQAINGVHCRKITDDNGSCEPTDVFLLLPSGDLAKAVTTAIEQEMPGARLLEWHALPDRGKRLTPSERRLLSLLREYDPATYIGSEIIAALDITERTYERMSVSLRKPHSVLIRELAAVGVEYIRKSGPGKEACFIKH